jgi:geranyl-CoA carboxylase alpha subunit
MSDTVPTSAFDTVLIANRGEIALRVMQSCQQLGLSTVAVYSEADSSAPHRFAADRALPIGAAAPKASYLNIPAIIAAAQASGAQAIHPGYGFLAENTEFARAVVEAGLIFIGPPFDAIHAMGNKAGAKAIMQRADVPCIPGYQGQDQSDAAFIEAAKRIGFPVMIKAAAGGGGRGMRRVDSSDAMLASLQSARSEAQNSFGDGELILEKAVIEPRHIEIQVFADQHGNVLHLGERDCSVQRRHQKVIEEAPSPVVTPALRAQMGAVAVAATRAIGYVGAGTLEFLLDGDGKFYFMEMNTRLQVEHAVTEAVLGVDLVAWQLQVAQGGRLPLSQPEVDARFASGGHAIEVRLCAEDPAQDFLPQSGPIAYWQAPPQVRCEHALQSGGEVSPHYDSMLAKIIAHGATREEALRKLARALNQTHLLGIASNREFLGQCLAHPVFRAGQATTGFIPNHLPPAARERPALDATTRQLAAALVAWQRQTRQPQRYPQELIGWASSSPYPQLCRFELDGEPVQSATVLLGANQGELLQGSERIGFVIGEAGDGTNGHTGGHAPARQLTLELAGVPHPVLWLPGYFVHAGRAYRLQDTTHLPATRATQAGGDGRVTAPMNGRVVSVAVAKGDVVSIGQTLLVLEAMKMEHTVLARVAGVVEEVMVQPGGQVGPGAVVVEIRPAA